MTIIHEAPQTHTVPHPARISRRTFLTRAGIGAGAIFVVAASGTVWRAFDQGVFATGEGPAYQAWGEWNAPAGGPLLPLVRAAVLAANAHDTQPWLFALGTNRIDLFADSSRTIGTMDPLRRELYLSLGCALENLCLAAQANGFTPTVTLLPTPGEATHAARIDLVPGPITVSPLYTAIPQRHTNRGAYDRTRRVDEAMLTAIAGLNAEPDLAVVWLTGDADKGRFGDLTLWAAAAIVADPEQARDDFAWWRADWQATQQHKDGITIDAAGLPDLTRAIGKMLPASSLADYGTAWVSGMRDHQVNTAAAFGLLVTHARDDNAQRLAAGRLWQRLHLYATTHGLAVQPFCQVPERIDREQMTGSDPVFRRGLAALLPETSGQAVMAFRIGYPTEAAHLSPRRPAQEVLRT